MEQAALGGTGAGRDDGKPTPCVGLCFGPSGVHVLPLAAGINEGGHYWSERSACTALGCWHKRYSKPHMGS